MAGQAAQVTWLQRSSSHVAALPATDPIATRLQRWLPRRAASRAIRWKNVLFSVATTALSRHRPELLKSMLRRNVGKALPAGFDVDTHFDGQQITLSDTLAYKGMMLSGVPNFALTVGYTKASWTLRADLVAHDVCRCCGTCRTAATSSPPRSPRNWARPNLLR